MTNQLLTLTNLAATRAFIQFTPAGELDTLDDPMDG
jgi:hypothetical protein